MVYKAYKYKPKNRLPIYKAGKAMKYLLNTRRIRYNTSPVFTETFKGNDFLVALGGAGGQIVFNMNAVPQTLQYQTLYRKYRILKAQVMFVPNWNSYDINTAVQNNSLVPPLANYQRPRIVYSVDTTPGVTPPANETEALTQNGCRIRNLDNIIRINCKPVPNTKDSNNNQMSFRDKYLNWQVTAGLPTNVDHTGISFWITQNTNLPLVASATISVYYKITFQLSDPL